MILVVFVPTGSNQCRWQQQRCVLWARPFWRSSSLHLTTLAGVLKNNDITVILSNVQFTKHAFDCPRIIQASSASFLQTVNSNWGMQEKIRVDTYAASEKCRGLGLKVELCFICFTYWYCIHIFFMLTFLVQYTFIPPKLEAEWRIELGFLNGKIYIIRTTLSWLGARTTRNLSR